MKSYYLDGEEKFGPILSFFYYLAIKLPLFSTKSFVVGDLLKTKAKTILDIGTGPGDIPIELAKSERFEKIYGIDPSTYMISIAKSRTRIENLHFLVGSSRHIPLKNKFDLIFTSISYHHWAKKVESLKYLKRFLNKKGEIRIYEFDADSLSGLCTRRILEHAIHKEQLYSEAKKAGLKVAGETKRGRLLRITLRKS